MHVAYVVVHIVLFKGNKDVCIFTVRLHVIATHGIAVAILSLCQLRVLWQKEIIVCRYLKP